MLSPGQTVGLARVYFDYHAPTIPNRLSLAIVTDPNDPSYTQFSDASGNALSASITGSAGGPYDVELAELPEPATMVMAAQVVLGIGGFFAWRRRRAGKAIC